MAEQVLKKLFNEQLNCSICLGTYTDPKLLQCFHVYCQQCLVPLVVRDQQGQLGLTCPTCRQVTPIPDRGVAGLQPAFHINHLLEVQESLQKAENPAATPEGAGRVCKVDKPSAVRSCFEHREEELRLYCETCGELVCVQCIMKGGKHHDHDCAVLKKAFEKYKEEIKSSLEPMEKQVATIKKALAQLDARCGEISDQQTVTEDNIHITFRQLREVLNVRETELVGQLHQLTQEKLKSLAAQRDEIETTLAQLNNCLYFMREDLRSGNEGDVLMLKAKTVRQVKELTAPFQAGILEPNTKADIVFSASAHMTGMCKIYGQLFSPGLPDHSQCHIAGDVTIVLEKSTAILQAINLEGIPCEEPILTIDGVDGPQLVALTHRGEMVVAEYNQHCVSVFSPNGERLRSFGGCGFCRGEFNGPHGVAVDGDECILVADRNNHWIQKFSSEGMFLAAVGTRGSGPLQFSRLAGIVFNSSNTKVYVVDWGNDHVQVLNSDLTFTGTFGTKGSGKGQFDGPCGIACDSTGKVYVTERGNHRVQVFTAEGRFLRMFGRRGWGWGELDYPNGVAVDTSDMVYVSEYGNQRVSVFTSEGVFVKTFGEALGAPYGVAVDDNGVVYVGYPAAGCIKVF